MTDPDAGRDTSKFTRLAASAPAKPPPWFVGGGKGLTIGVLVLVAILIAASVASTGYLAAEGYRLWRASTATNTPRSLSVAARRPMPIGRPVEWFDQNDYPAAALRRSEQGRVRVTLLVGTDGVPVACQVIEHSGSKALDAATCRAAVRHGRFFPALDSRGRPVEARYVLPRVVWRLPG